MTKTISTWTTQDGKAIEIKWMDSVHLARTYNDVNQTAHYNAYAIRTECRRRGLLEHNEDYVYLPAKCETLVELCFMNAMLDLSLVHWREAPMDEIIHLAQCGNKEAQQIVTLTTQYRMERS